MYPFIIAKLQLIRYIIKSENNSSHNATVWHLLHLNLSAKRYNYILEIYLVNLFCMLLNTEYSVKIVSSYNFYNC